MRIVVTQVAGDGSIRRGVLDTADGRCEELIEQASLAAPPPYRPVRGRPVYQIRTGDRTILVTDSELAGPWRDLVMAALAK